MLNTLLIEICNKISPKIPNPPTIRTTVPIFPFIPSLSKEAFIFNNIRKKIDG